MGCIQSNINIVSVNARADFFDFSLARRMGRISDMHQLAARFARAVASMSSFAVFMSVFTGCMTTTLAVNRAVGYDSFSPHDPNLRGQRQPRLKPNPAYYALLPLTVPFDIATLPLQIVIEENMSNHGPFILNQLNQL